MTEENNAPPETQTEPLPAAPALESPQTQFICKDCNNRPFKSKGGLKAHVLKYHPKAQASTTSPAAPVEPKSAAKKPVKKSLVEKVDSIFFRT